MDKFDNDSRLEDDSPPFFNSWKGAYLFLMAHLFFLILLFHLFTRFFE